MLAITFVATASSTVSAAPMLTFLFIPEGVLAARDS
jgi:hypothetical protein